MNPFLWSAYLFLVLMLVLTLAAVGLLLFWRLKRGPQATPGKPLQNPYLAAYLAGGSSRTLRVGVWHLVTLGLLGTVAGRVKRGKPDAETLADNELHKKIITLAGDGCSVDTLLRDPALFHATKWHESALLGDRLLTDGGGKAWYQTRAFALAVPLVLLTLLKLLWDLFRSEPGATELGVFFALQAAVLGYLAFVPPRLTPKGHAVLTLLRQRFLHQVRTGASSGGDEDVMIAAVYGPQALPTTQQALVRVIFQKAR